MSMGSEMIDELSLDYELWQERFLHDKTWKTKKGEILKIVDMETSHIKNVIAMCNGKDIYAPTLMYQTLQVREIMEGNKQ